MAPQTQLEDSNLAEDKGKGITASEEVPKMGKNGPRKRVSQACDRCRSRKDKCDGKKPVRAFSYIYTQYSSWASAFECSGKDFVVIHSSKILPMAGIAKDTEC